MDINYPKANISLRENILNMGGGLISEFPFGTKPDKGLFVIRNRLIAGISLATIVIESDIKGGSMITAEYCKKYSRDLFALPGSIYSDKSRGTIKLIKEGAIPITSYQDVLSRYHWNLWSKAVLDNNKNKGPSNKNVIKKEANLKLSSQEEIVYNIISNSPKTIDELHLETNISTNELTRILLNLEIKGVIEKRRGYIVAK
jgi:DNA processing protein